MKEKITLKLMVCFLVIVFAGIVCRANAQGTSRELKKADSAYLAKDWKSARMMYEKTLKDTSRNGIAWNRLGFCYYNTGNMDAAVKAYTKALQYARVAPLKVSVYSRMARVNSLQNRKDLALANIDSAIANGYNLVQELDTLKDFASVRGETRFKDLRQKVFLSAYPCMANAQARQFDFWVGEWDAYVRNTQQFAGHSIIQIVSGGCAVLENWTSASSNYSGKSLNFIDPATGKWRQTWVGNSDMQDFVNGEYKDGAMRFTFETTDAKGKKQTGRFIFYNEGPNQVRQFNELSADDGKTWTTNYDFTYVRKKAAGAIQ